MTLSLDILNQLILSKGDTYTSTLYNQVVLGKEVYTYTCTGKN